MPAEFGQIIHVTSYSSSASEIVSSVLTMPSDVSGTLSVRKVVLFGGQAVRVNGSVLMSLTGGDTTSLVGSNHSDAAWAAMLRGLASALNLSSWQVSVEDIRSVSSGLLVDFLLAYVDGE